jgi:CxxC motif-containing protein (DUF1111 family)
VGRIARSFLGSLVALAVVGPATAAFAGNNAGRELFVRTWLPWDTRVDGGDGLGPMYNAASCVACHNQGGTGGAGGREHNVRLVPLEEERRSLSGSRSAGPTSFVVEHRHTTLAPRAVGGTSRSAVERNTPALFGAGLIDGIPDEVLLDLEAEQRTAGGPVSGRVAQATDGGVGRFGWKGHTPSLASFVATACANELGLSVEGHRQGAPPPGDLSERLSLMEQALAANGAVKDLQNGPGLDMTPKEVAALTAFVRSLPAPAELTAQPRRDQGRELLKSTGCDACHVQNVGPVKNVYSDLLLHDMGQRLGDAAGAYQTRGQAPMADAGPASEAVSAVDAALAGDVGPTAASAQEWRTPPLWGVRDSGPYLHDGRAATLDEAIRSHGGEAEPATNAYQALTITEQQLLISFLESLSAPTGS